MNAHKSIMAGLKEAFVFASGTTDVSRISMLRESVGKQVFRKVNLPRALVLPKEHS